MTKFRWRSVPLAALLICGSALAEPAILDLATVLAQAEQANPGLRAATSQAQAATARIMPAAALDDPIFSYALAPNSLGAPGLDPGHIVGVAQPLPWPGKLRQRRQQAEANADWATARLGGAREELHRAVRRAYADWAYLETALRLNKEQRQRQAERETTARGRYRSGAGGQPLLLAAGLAQRQREVEAAMLEAQRAAAQARLNALRDRPARASLGRPSAPVRWAPPPTLAALLDAADEAHPELRALIARQQAATATAALARLDDAPDLRLTAQYLGTLPRKENRGQIGLALNLPFGRDKRRGRQAAAAAEVEAAAAELAQRRRELEADLASALAKDQAASQVLALHAEALLPLARQLVASREADYVSGAGSAEQLIDAEDGWLAAQLSEARAWRDAAWARAELAWLSGGRIDAALYEPQITNTTE